MDGARVRSIAALLLAVVLATLSASQALSSDEWAFEAFQPIWSFGDIWLSRVTVLTYDSDDVGINAVLATCDSNQVMTQYGPQQRNAAFEIGLRAEVTFHSNHEPPLFGDTLRVILHATKPPSDKDDFDYATIVAATVQCVLLNAAQSPAVRFVALRIDGETTYKKYGGVFATSPYRKGPKSRDFPPQ